MTDAVTQGLQVYVVGGAVRDGLLGLPAGDRDWVVVGATPERMTQRGFTPVGGDFPVFLHPVTHEEYALARTERKTSRGYQGFAFYTGPEVTLADDLRRRDLTVNAIARDSEGVLCDPLGGVRDLHARVFRHVGEAFAEDPVRILRLARFAARFVDFSVAAETMALCRQMVDSGEVDALVAERVWKELSRGLMAQRPSRMFDVLRECGALARIAPDLVDDPGLGDRIDAAHQADLPLAARYALLTVASPSRDALSRRWRVPTACADHARLLPALVQDIHALTQLQGLCSRQAPSLSRDPAATAPPHDSAASAHPVPTAAPTAAYAWPAADTTAATAQAEAVVDILEKNDAKRQPERLLVLLRAAASMIEGEVDMHRWRAWVQAILDLDGGAIARSCQGDVSRIKPALRAARVQAVRDVVA